MLGARIALLRRESGWSQKELAGHLEISPSAVGMYEQGRREPSNALLLKMARDYGKTIVIVTHNMQQAVRISDRTAFFLLGELIECDGTEKLFSAPSDKRTEDYITGRFG